VVTFIANYLSTELPTQMQVNDLQHEILVENEVGHVSAVLSSMSYARYQGAEIVQPVALGSLGAPPFAPPDRGMIKPGVRGSSETVNFTLSGPFSPPSIGTPNSGSLGGCSTSSKNGNNTTGISCTGSHNVVWNFSAGNGLFYSVSGNGGLGAIVNFSTSGSTIVIGSVGGAIDRVFVLGNNDSVYVNATGGANVKVLVVGSYDTLNLNAKGGSGFSVEIVGNHDTTSESGTGGGNLVLVGYGSNDAFTGSGSGSFGVYWNGFNLENVSSGKCPYGNIALTDTVGGSAGTVTYNNTNYNHANGSGNASGWTYIYNNPPPSISRCPFVAQGAVTQGGIIGSDFVVSLLNSYAPSSEVAFDEGAVVYAQAGGVPVLVDGPGITLNGTRATVWVPLFENLPQTEAGAGTANLILRLVSIQQQSWPSGGFVLPSGSRVLVTILSPYAAGWVAYLSQQSTLAGLFTCTGAQNVCSAGYTHSGQLGKIVISLPVTQLQLRIALFSVSLS
jgi:hypothetical protein